MERIIGRKKEIPYYLSMLKKGESIAANIENLFFAKGIKNISLEDCKYDISAKNVRIAAYANVGIIILYAIMAISFITSIIYY